MPHRRPDRPGPALSPARASSGVVKRFDQQMIPTSPPAAPFVSPALLLRFPRESGGLGTAMAPLLQHGPQRREYSAGRMLGFTPLSFPPRKRGPRSRGGAAATARTSAQRAFRRQHARVHAHFVSPAKAEAQEPPWRRCHSTDLSAADIPPARR